MRTCAECERKSIFCSLTPLPLPLNTTAAPATALPTSYTPIELLLSLLTYQHLLHAHDVAIRVDFRGDPVEDGLVGVPLQALRRDKQICMTTHEKREEGDIASPTFYLTIPL